MNETLGAKGGTATPGLHLGIIPDGSRRWGRREGKPDIWDGAESGAKVEEILTHLAANCPDVDEVTIWAMSTENLRRTDRDRRKVYQIVERLLTRTDAFADSRVRLNFVGSRTDELPRSLTEAMEAATARTTGFDRLTLNIGLGYGGREEIVRAVDQIVRSDHSGGGRGAVTAEEFEACLMVPRSLDLVVRTGGERRLSGFMLYQVEYAELFFTDTLWPDFSTGELDACLDDYRRRDRRFGK